MSKLNKIIAWLLPSTSNKEDIDHGLPAVGKSIDEETNDLAEKIDSLYKCIDKNEAKELIKDNMITIADIRDPDSYKEGNIPGSINLTDENIEEFIETADRNAPLLVYCYHGNSSMGAAEYLANNGFSSVFSLNGGFVEYSK